MNTKKSEMAIMPDWGGITKVKKYKKGDFDKFSVSFLKSKREIYKKIKSIKREDRNFENTILALENCDEDYSDKIYQIGAYSITHKEKVWRDAASDFQKELSEKMVDIEYDKDIYLAVKDYIEGNYKKEKSSLEKKYGVGTIKLVEDTFKGYKRMGFDLPKAKQEKLKNNLKKLSKLSIDFSKNIDEYKDFILCNQEELKALPENFINTLEKVGEKYKITLEYPSIGPFIKYAESREKRKEISDKNYRKGGEINLKILAEIVKIRDENAKILGYKNHVAFKTENRMAKSEKNVRDFVGSLLKKLVPKSNKELKELNNFAKQNLAQYKDIKNIEYYDIAYVSNKLKEDRYSYDSAKLKEYFELEHVLKTTFNLFGELFNFTVSEVKEKEKRSVLVDKDVRLYEFKDKKTKKIISYLILDLFPRDGKYGHAGHTRFCTNIKTIPIDLLVCNFQKPSKKLPSLLTLQEVETLFHELGHGLHCMLSRTKHSSQNGSNADHDFVEVPSQFLEEFFFEKSILKRLAVHYVSKMFLDNKTIEKIVAGKNFFVASSRLRQLVLSLFDLNLHTNQISFKKDGLDIAKEFTKTSEKYNGIKLPKLSLYPADWIHLEGEYGGGYYSYMWALVYAQDFYSEFKKVINNKKKLKEIGERYRREILEVGGSRDEMESVKKFLKRAPNNKAFLEELGI